MQRNHLLMAQPETFQRVLNESHREEGRLTKRIEQQTARIPSIGFLGLAVGSMVASIAFFTAADRKDTANFVGLWAPVFLLIGVYNKIVKLEGSEASDRKSSH